MFEIIITRNAEDPADDLRWAARVRRDLWAYSAVEIDPDSPSHETRRDADANAYFEFATDRLSEVERVLQEYGHTKRARAEVVQEGAGTECVNCGYISPQLAAVCPSCQFRDIEPCPYCNHEIARLSYLPVSGDIFSCPTCHHRVRLQFNDPVIDGSGRYSEPLVRVSPAEAPASHEV